MGMAGRWPSAEEGKGDLLGSGKGEEKLCKVWAGGCGADGWTRSSPVGSSPLPTQARFYISTWRGQLWEVSRAAEGS